MIILDRVSKKYRHKAAVNNVSLQISRGCIFALLGPNGAGKSTTIRLMTTLLKADEGYISIAGHDVAKEAKAIRNRIGVVFQSPSLDDELTVTENLKIHALMHSMSGPAALFRTHHVLDLMDLHEYKKSPTKTLSGGLKRRVEIARSLMHTPDIIFLDEPTIGLDTHTRVAMWHHLKNLSKNENVTIVFTTHYLEEAEEFSEHVAIIDNGSIVANGTVDNVKQVTSSSTLQEAYLKLTDAVPRVAA